jgi:hypothetical protein
MLLRGEKTPDPEHGWSALKSVDRTAMAGCKRISNLLNPRPRVVSVLDMVGFPTSSRSSPTGKKRSNLFNVQFFNSDAV